jgi:hypothetical protein
MRLLYVGDEYYASLAAVRSLRAAGHEPWLAAVEGLATFAERSRAVAGTVRVPGPREDAGRFAAVLAEHAARLGAAAVLPGTEPALNALAGRDDDFSCPLGVPEAAVLDRALDKTLLAPLAAEAGLDLPPQADPGSFPAVVKPLRRSVLVDGRVVERPQAARVGSAGELAAYADSLPGVPCATQPFLEGRLRAVVGVAWEGRVVCSLHQEATRIYPHDCGASAFAVTVPVDAPLDAAARRLLGLVGWSGIFELQFVDAGRPYLVDLNPRVYGSIGLAIGAGHDLPAIWAELLLGGQPDVGDYRVGVGFRAEERDARALLGAFRAGRRGEALAGLLWRPRTVHAVVSLRDPLPLVHLVRRAAGRAARG